MYTIYQEPWLTTQKQRSAMSQHARRLSELPHLQDPVKHLPVLARGANTNQKLVRTLPHVEDDRTELDSFRSRTQDEKGLDRPFECEGQETV